MYQTVEDHLKLLNIHLIWPFNMPVYNWIKLNVYRNEWIYLRCTLKSGNVLKVRVCWSPFYEVNALGLSTRLLYVEETIFFNPTCWDSYKIIHTFNGSHVNEPTCELLLCMDVVVKNSLVKLLLIVIWLGDDNKGMTRQIRKTAWNICQSSH